MKKEVRGLSSLEDSLDKFQKNWIKPVQDNTNRHLPFLQNLSPETKQELNQKLAKFKEQFYQIKNAQRLQEKLGFALRQVIELKLATLNGDQTKAKMISKKLLIDDFVNLKEIIAQVCILEENIQKIQTSYDEINQMLQKKLSLEESIIFMEQPHKSALYNLLKTAQQQKKIVHKLGRNFLDLVKDTKKKEKGYF